MSIRIISGEFGGRTLKAPKGDTTRPTTAMAREAIFNRCQHLIDGARVLDLFAGSGAIGFEALSRGALFVTFVEKDRNAAKCIQENGDLLKLQGKYQILQMPAQASLVKLKEPYDLIYIDPPYDLDIAPILREIGSHLKPTGVLFFEERFHKNPPPVLPCLKHIDSRRYGEALIHQYHPLESP